MMYRLPCLPLHMFEFEDFTGKKIARMIAVSLLWRLLTCWRYLSEYAQLSWGLHKIACLCARIYIFLIHEAIQDRRSRDGSVMDKYGLDQQVFASVLS